MSNEFVMVPRELLDKWETCLLAHDLHGIADEVRAILAQPAAQHQGEPVAYIVGNFYRTQEGKMVRFVRVHNEGTSYESMEDESGVNRYTRRDFGRVTGTCHNYSDPRNTPPLYTHADTGEVERLHTRLREEQAYVSELAEQNTTMEKERDTLLGQPCTHYGVDAACMDCLKDWGQWPFHEKAAQHQDDAIGTLSRDAGEKIVFTPIGDPHIKDGMPVFAQAERNQGEPVAWRGINELGEVVTDRIDGTPPESMVDLCGNSGSYDKIELAYTHADTGEVEQLSQIISNLNEERDELGAEVGRLREGIGKHWEVVCDQMAELDALRAQLAETQRISQEEELRANRYSQQLAERDALLRRWVVYGQAELHTGVTIAQHLVADTKGALSASAEPVDECAHSHSNKFGCPECGEEFIRTNERNERAGKDLYTCDGKGGTYELLGLATGAGMASGEDRLIYRDATTRRLFLRTEQDFSARMKKIGEYSAEPSAPTARQAQALKDEKRLGIERFPAEPVERDERAAFLAWANDEYQIGEGYELNEKNRDLLENQKGWMARAALERKR